MQKLEQMKAETLEENQNYRWEVQTEMGKAPLEKQVRNWSIKEPRRTSGREGQARQIVVTFSNRTQALQGPRLFSLYCSLVQSRCSVSTCWVHEIMGDFVESRGKK